MKPSPTSLCRERSRAVRATVPSRSRIHSGFSLVEVAVAVAVASVSLISLMAMLPLGLSMSSSAIEQTGANGILSSVVADLQATPRGVDATKPVTSAQYSIPIPGNPVVTSPAITTLYFTGDRQFTASLETWSRYRVTLTCLPNAAAGPTASKAATLMKLVASWPATADPATSSPTGSVVVFAALDRN